MAGKDTIPASERSELYYRIPESAHEELHHIRGELGMLAHLTQRDCCNRDDTLHLSAAALAQCFARLSVEIEEILESCLSSADCEALEDRSRH